MLRKTPLSKSKAKTEAKPPIRKRTVRAAKKKELPQAPEFGLHNLKSPKGSRKARKLLGRGPGSGHGKTSTRGSKGQTSRAGRHFYLGFEGGQMPLIRKIPKRGFISKFKKEFQLVDLKDLNKVSGPTVTVELLEQSGLIKDKGKPVKVLADGEITSPVTVQAHAFSKKALEKIRGAGGRAEVINA
jgi:large subunit ribosomal protein L15